MSIAEELLTQVRNWDIAQAEKKRRKVEAEADHTPKPLQNSHSRWYLGFLDGGTDDVEPEQPQSKRASTAESKLTSEKDVKQFLADSELLDE